MTLAVEMHVPGINYPGSDTSAPITLNMVTGNRIGIGFGARTFNPPDASRRARFVIRLSTDNQFSFSTYYQGSWQPKGTSYSNLPNHVPPSITLPTLDSNTKYYIRAYIQSESGTYYDGITASFYTNRSPLAPPLVAPADMATFDGTTDVTFDWTFSDPDAVLGSPHSVQKGAQVRFRTTETPLQPAGAWVTKDVLTSATALTVSIAEFASNSQFEWQVRTQDYRDLWGPWSDTPTFYMGGTTSAPVLQSPTDNEALLVDQVQRFEWLFRDPNQASLQTNADLRYRIVGDPTWTTLTGTVLSPGDDHFWDIAANTFTPGVSHEWQVRTYNSLSLASSWSESSYFIPVLAGDQSAPVTPTLAEEQYALGVGRNRVYVYERGGKRRLGEITPLNRLQWGRKRDDISNALITTAGFGEDGGALLSQLRTWRHELVIFRDGKRVWEGPITRITYGVDSLEIEAKDVMNYVYRRILKQGFNDAYQMVNGVQRGLNTVVYRARQIIMNALSYDDPNVLPYLTALMNDDDARQSRVVAPYSKTAWGEVDDLAATAGLDYTVVGRRIVLVDTHRGLGQLPEMTDGDFSEPPVVTEYGMQAANIFAVTNNNGVYGVADARPFDLPPSFINRKRITGPEGFLEQLASAYGESDGAATSAALTAKARAKLQATLRTQAQRNIAGRWPIPVVVRVPDNARISPEVNIGMDQLVPGVWIPVRAQHTLRTVAQMQKLDSMTVTQAGDQDEQVTCVLSPAPLPGDDDDGGGEEE